MAMTVLGCLVAPDRAIIWGDSEVYLDNRPCGFAAKLTINPTASLALVAAGKAPIAREAEAFAYQALNIDDAEKRLAPALRKRSCEIAMRETIRDASWFASNFILAVGYSSSAGRMVAWRYAAGALFEPVLTGSMALPADDGIENEVGAAVIGGRLETIVAIARRQVALLRQRGLVDAHGGSLAIAEVGPTTVRAWRMPDFDVQASSCASSLTLHELEDIGRQCSSPFL
jgi:hypothetical protein